MPSSYAIGQHFEAMIQRLLQSGRYSNASEVVRAGLRLLEEREEALARQQAEFWAKIDQGLQSAREGRLIPADEVFKELERIVSQRQNSRDAAE
jgi:antitoxin ParD1/3/4